MVHLLVCSNMVDIEGIVSAMVGPQSRTAIRHIHRLVEQFAKCSRTCTGRLLATDD